MIQAAAGYLPNYVAVPEGPDCKQSESRHVERAGGSRPEDTAEDDRGSVGECGVETIRGAARPFGAFCTSPVLMQDTLEEVGSDGHPLSRLYVQRAARLFGSNFPEGSVECFQCRHAPG